MPDRSVQHDTLVIDRTFDADVARVFAAWATPASRKHWTIPKAGWEIADDESDFRVGGREVSHFGPPGDPRYRAETHYLDIVDNARIVMAGTMSDAGRRISASLATVEFLARAGRTRLIYTEQAAFLDGLDTPESRRGGWNQNLDGLERFLNSTRREGP